MKKHSLFTALTSLQGNPRGCVFPEPLWGIPFHLYSPYVSIFMVALGVTESQIGLILSISWGFQLILALLSGAVTDKLGRRRTTLIFDIFAWTIPALISAVAQNFWYFLIAGIVNSVWRITHNSWTCLLVEDAEPEQLVDIYTWIYIANLVSGFIAPLAGLLIGIFDLVPTVRGLYVFAAFMFTLKAIVTYQLTDETARGKIRMQQTEHESVFRILRGYRAVAMDVLRTPATLFTGSIMLVLSITSLINGTFWAIIVTEKLQVPAANIANFAFLKSAFMLAFFFLVTPRFSQRFFRVPLVLGFLVFVISQVVLVTAPALGYPSLIVSVLLEASGFAVVSPLVDKLAVLTISAAERARVQSILAVGIILFTAPFGWIAGNLSELNKDLPFLLNICLFSVGALLAYLAGLRRPVAEVEVG